MKLASVFLVSSALAGLPAHAVYAPVPTHEQGKAWTVSLTGGSYYDSNVFGAASGEIDSLVWTASSAIAFNASVTDQTFLAARYGATLDYVVDRPDHKDLLSHDLFARVAHAFSPKTTIDFYDTYTISKNPEELLPGTQGNAPGGVVNTDQSYKRNELNGRFTTAVTEKGEVTLKARTTDYRYDNARLGENLDRVENLFGVTGAYALLPETKLVAEYRFQTIRYDNESTSGVAGFSNKDKDSHFVLAGVDHTVGPKLSASARLGAEFRERKGDRSEDAPYAELSGRYAYLPKSYVAAGYAYTLEENSNVDAYTDTQVNRLFVNVEHTLTAMIVASGSLTYEPSTLQGRRGVSPDRDETTTRFGAGLTYLAPKNWSVTATLDVDNVDSDDPNRDLERTRVGVRASYVF